jgi:hypothetical protein
MASAWAQDAVAYQPALDAAWAGRTSEALRLIEAYLAEHPDDHAAQLDHARFLAWLGDYAKADDALAPFGADDEEAAALHARVLAWAERRDAALALNAPLYAADPDDYNNAWTQALILRQGEWPHQALPALATVQAIKPDDKDSIDLAKSVRLPLFSSVGVAPSVYSDSDDIEIRSVGIDTTLWLSDRWRLLAGATRREHSATFGGAFAPLLGDNHVDENRIGAGLRFAPSPDAALELWLGNSRIDNGIGSDGETIGHLRFSQYANDAFGYALTYDRDRVDASPRALAVMRNGLAADLHWAPTLRDRFDARIASDDFDDDNRRTSVLASYARAVHRGERVSLDLGAGRRPAQQPQHRQRLLQPGPLSAIRARSFQLCRAGGGSGTVLVGRARPAEGRDLRQLEARHRPRRRTHHRHLQPLATGRSCRLQPAPEPVRSLRGHHRRIGVALPLLCIPGRPLPVRALNGPASTGLRRGAWMRIVRRGECPLRPYSRGRCRDWPG